MLKKIFLVGLASLTPFLASADTIQFTGVPTGVNDGVYYVTPYQITINGAPQLVTCYDTLDDVNFGDTWQANILTMNQAASTGYFSGPNALAGYQRVAWLDGQSYSTQAQQVGLQHAIWNVFGAAPTTTPEELQYEAAADIAQSNGYAGYDFSGFRFVDQVGGVAGHMGTEQGFVFEQISTPTGTSGGPVPAVPEPNSFALWICGLLLIGFWRFGPRPRRAAARSNEQEC